MRPNRGNTADQCRELGLKVGDTIEGMETYEGGWCIEHLTLLWVGETTAVFRQSSLNSSNPLMWTQPRESASWDLSHRDWRLCDE